MKIFLTFLTFLFFSFFSHAVIAQTFPSEVWHQGTVVLTSDDTLKGLVKYDVPNDAVQVKVTGEERIQAFNAQKLFFFEIFDSGIKSYRQFYSLPYQVNTDYTKPLLFEVLYEGKLTLLCREKIIMEGDRTTEYELSHMPIDGRLMLGFDFYFLENDGEIHRYQPKRRLLLSIMDRKYNEVKKYIKRNNLRHDHISDLVRITAYYNALGQ